jgi:hypothetical protein
MGKTTQKPNSSLPIATASIQYMLFIKKTCTIFHFCLQIHPSKSAQPSFDPSIRSIFVRIQCSDPVNFCPDPDNICLDPTFLIVCLIRFSNSLGRNKDPDPSPYQFFHKIFPTRNIWPKSSLYTLFTK